MKFLIDKTVKWLIFLATSICVSTVFARAGDDSTGISVDLEGIKAVLLKSDSIIASIPNDQKVNGLGADKNYQVKTSDRKLIGEVVDRIFRNAKQDAAEQEAALEAIQESTIKQRLPRPIVIVCFPSGVPISLQVFANHCVINGFIAVSEKSTSSFLRRDILVMLQK